MKAWRTLGQALTLAILVALSPARAQELPPQDLSVMLTFKDATGADIDECAAGIVVAQSASRTLILTAYHVLGLQPGEAANGRTIQVEFKQRRGERFTARILPGSGFQDPALDYLMVAVEPMAPNISRDAFFALTPAPDGQVTR